MRTQGIYLGIVISLLVMSCKTSSPVIGVQNGNVAPEISANTITNTAVKLSELRGKMVLLEFWDSNNSVARKNHFEIQRMYVKHKGTEFKNGTGFEVYSISLDTDKAAWQKAVDGDGITWQYNVIETNAWNAKSALDYKIASLPKYYLINGKGEIINHNILIPDLEKLLTNQMD
jgi:peroxiredoxin